MGDAPHHFLQKKIRPGGPCFFSSDIISFQPYPLRSVSTTAYKLIILSGSQSFVMFFFGVGVGRGLFLFLQKIISK